MRETERKHVLIPGAALPNKVTGSTLNGGTSISFVIKAIGRSMASLLQKLSMAVSGKSWG